MNLLHKSPAPHNVLQEYLQALEESRDAGPSVSQQKVLSSYAELQHQLHCSICCASVRHVLPVTAEHTDGTIAEYSCLCTRCPEAERVASNRVVITVGKARLEHNTTHGATHTRTFRAYGT